jgi:hypothetical protein
MPDCRYCHRPYDAMMTLIYRADDRGVLVPVAADCCSCPRFTAELVPGNLLGNAGYRRA